MSGGCVSCPTDQSQVTASYFWLRLSRPYTYRRDMLLGFSFKQLDEVWLLGCIL